jgi:hypothetical protein
MIMFILILGEECAKRWQHHLDPRLNRREWTKAEVSGINLRAGNV